MWQGCKIWLILVFTLAIGFAHAQFAGGSKTTSDPWDMVTVDDLNSVHNYLSAYFLLSADILLGIILWNQGSEWLPIQAFRGGRINELQA